MKRVLKISAVNGGTTAKVRIEVECTSDVVFDSTRERAGRVITSIADGVMEVVRNAKYFEVPLSRQRVGR